MKVRVRMSKEEQYESRVEKFLDVVLDNVRYKKWYLGHLHVDLEIKEFNMQVLFDKVDRLR